MKYKRIQNKIVKFLEQQGAKNTYEIYEHINDNDANGIVMAALCNVLSKNKKFVECEKVRVEGITQSSYTLSVWKIEHGDNNSNNL